MVRVLKEVGRWTALFVSFVAIYLWGSSFVGGYLPEIMPEPGPVRAEIALLLVIWVHVLVIAAMIRSSRWRGVKLMASVGFAYYGTTTFVMQIETWYFLSGLTVDPALLPRLFLMGLPVAVLYVPLAVWLLGKGRGSTLESVRRVQIRSLGQVIWRLLLIAFAYVVVYWLAGYFIAWQNPELRAFYGSPGPSAPFWTHTMMTLREDPFLFPFQVLRAMLWTLFAWPVIRGSRWSLVPTMLLVGALFALPQNIGHLLANPLIPQASVRFSHMVETALSTFVFGCIVTALLYKRKD